MENRNTRELHPGQVAGPAYSGMFRTTHMRRNADCVMVSRTSCPAFGKAVT